MRRPRPAAVLAALAPLAVVAAGCNPDPTTGRPPPPGDPAPPFTVDAHPVGPGTAHPLRHSWRPGCPVAPEHLVLLELDHWGYDGRPQRGRIVVHVWVAPALAGAFEDLWDARFQIERMEPVDAYGGDDARSMEANNTSAFNCRRVAGTARWSEHASGTAVDLNPVQNPYVRGDRVEPPAGRDWLDRSSPTPGMVQEGDTVVAAFDRIGWGWGGRWRSARDYQHFSASGR